ncbi:MAG TPA: peptidylprolyl isomerase [Anaerolineaceae bacterium]|nr:peptidylprolyl isomerase [Anaerolineaceae bacterium]
MKKLLLIIAAAGLALAACSPGGQATRPPISSPAATATRPGTPPPAPATPMLSGSGAANLSAAACTVVRTVPTPEATEVSIFPAPEKSDWSLGATQAKMTVIEYADFGCSKCALQALVFQQLVKDFPQDFRLVFRSFAPQPDDNSFLTAQAAEAAGQQDKFWEMHDLLYAKQAAWTSKTPAELETWLVEQAKSIQLDGSKFQGDLKSQAVVDKIKKEQEFAASIHLPYTPFLLVNGKIYTGPSDYINLSNLVKVIQLQERQYSTCPAMSIDPQKQYLARIQSSRGDIVIELYPGKAPFTVNNFVFLARNHWYDGVTFHRVVTNPDVAQAGDPTATGWGGPGYAFADEISPDLKFDRPGVVGMANAGPNTNGSQFFITRSPISYLNGKYPIFGQVIQGLDVVQKLTPRDPSQGGNLPPGDRIDSITIEEK